MNNIGGAAPLMQVIHVLGDHGNPVAAFQFRQQAVGRVRLNRQQLAAAFVVEPQYQLTVTLECLRGGYVVHTVLLPQPAVVTEEIGRASCRERGSMSVGAVSVR